MRKHLVFVYGTLRKGEGNHSLLSNAKRVWDRCWTFGTLYDTGLGYPCISPDGEGQVLGELYEVTDLELQRLDHLEGYYGPGQDNDYERMSKWIYRDDQKCLALLYFYSNEKLSNLKVIHSGDWRKR